MLSKRQRLHCSWCLAAWGSMLASTLYQSRPPRLLIKLSTGAPREICGDASNDCPIRGSFTAITFLLLSPLCPLEFHSSCTRSLTTPLTTWIGLPPWDHHPSIHSFSLPLHHQVAGPTKQGVGRRRERGFTANCASSPFAHPIHSVTMATGKTASERSLLDPHY